MQQPALVATPPQDLAPEHLSDESHRRARREEQVHATEQRRRLLHAGLTTLCLLSLVAGAGLQAAGLGPAWLWWLLAGTSFVSGGAFATKNALEELRSGEFNVDLLMISAALGAATIGHWQEGGVLLFLFSLSGTLEEFAMGRTRQAIRALMSLAPEDALVRRHGIEHRIPVEQVQVGDTVIVKPGERIAADGIVLSGASAVDQSAITGEALPVEVQPGSFVHAGTINLHGSLEVRATRRATETTLAKIIRLVEEAQEQKSPTQRFTDWFGRRYTIGVIAAALAMGTLPPFLLDWPWSTTIYRAMTLLVVASPCALVISTPATVLSAIANAARHGILFKGGAHLESTGRCRAVIFDKTGTLTHGRAHVTDILALDGTQEAEVLRLAAAIEQLSDHPLAQAIVEEARRRNLAIPKASNLQAAHGKGVRAEIDGYGYEVLVGNERFLEEHCLAVSPQVQQQIAALRATGKTAVLVGTRCKDRHQQEPSSQCCAIRGIIGLADTLRAEARMAVERLRALGIEHIVMLTGDNAAAAGWIAAQLGIEYRAELLPEDKVAVVRELAQRYGGVIMVGDGVNDAPALAAATVGMAMGAGGTDVALETADVVLMAGDLSKVAYAIELSRRANRVVRQNLAFAIGVIVTLVLSNLAGTLPLPLGVVGHEGSTLVVVLNGLRLLGGHPRLS